MQAKNGAKLSKSILDMKFMKKSKERVQKEEEDAEGQAMYSSEITEEMRKSGNTLFIETSISTCKDLVEGRLSFGGMNPEVERLMVNTYNQKFAEASKRKEKDISDVEMATGYSTVADTINKKFTDKKHRNQSRKFMKPPVEDLFVGHQDELYKAIDKETELIYNILLKCDKYFARDYEASLLLPKVSK